MFLSWSGVVRDGKGGPVGLQRGTAVLQPGGIPVLPQEQGHRQSGVLCRRRVKARAPRFSVRRQLCAASSPGTPSRQVIPLFLFSVVVVLLIELCCVPLVVFALAPDQSRDFHLLLWSYSSQCPERSCHNLVSVFRWPSFLPLGVLIG